MTAAPEVIAAARDHITRGRAIVAARADKRPWGKDWRRWHTAGEIEALLAGPDCVGIGFLGGELNNGIVPLDFDSESGERWWRKECEAAGIDPEDFPTVITPGKIKDGARRPGRHRYVTDIRGILGNGAGTLKELGIDVRGRGHAMLPPSPHPDGGVYQWEPGHSLDDFSDGIPPCPDFVYAAIEGDRPAASPAAKGAGPEFSASDSAYRYCRAALDGERQRVAEESRGSRNQALNNGALALGCLVHHGAFTEDEARAALAAACEANGLISEDGRASFEATFTSGWRKGITEPRAVPERGSGTCKGLHPEIEQLAKLSELEYDRARKATAKKLGIRVGVLDAAVRASRESGATQSAGTAPWNGRSPTRGPSP